MAVDTLRAAKKLTYGEIIRRPLAVLLRWDGQTKMMHILGRHRSGGWVIATRTGNDAGMVIICVPPERILGADAIERGEE